MIYTKITKLSELVINLILLNYVYLITFFFQDHALVLHSIIGWNSTVGAWARVEGTPCDPNPNKPFAKMENVPLFNNNGRLNPSITVLGMWQFLLSVIYCEVQKIE